jgi:site-specific DNA-methyltransferase (adenine-specific)
MISDVLFKSDKTEWETPQWLFDLLDAEYHFTLDACATQNNAKCAAFFTSKQDGLKRAWRGSVWINPPYGRKIGQWVDRAKQQIRFKRIERIVMLLPSRTDTKWWHRSIMHGAKEIRFIEGRLRFVGAAGFAPFPSVIVVYDHRSYPFYVGPSINARKR